MEDRPKSTLRIGYLLQQDVDIINLPYDGPANHVREVIKELISRGHEVRVLLGLEGKIWKSDNLRDFERVNVLWMDQGPIRLFERVVRRLQYELQLPYASLFESVRFALACRQHLIGFDLLYERMSWASFGGLLAARLCRVPLVLESNGDHLRDLDMKGIAPKGLQLLLSSTATGRVVHSAAHIVVSGEGWRDHFIKRWDVTSDHVTTVENGTILTKILSRNDLCSFSQPNSSSLSVKIVYIGGFHPWQGIPFLLKAIASVLKFGIDVNLLAIGSGPGQAEAIRLANDLKVVDKVDFLGQLAAEQFAPILASADIAVAPYCGWPEFSGLKLFDYKAAGLAVITSGRNGQPATLVHGKTGWIVPPCDEDALSKAIIKLASNPEFRRRMGQAARLDAESSHGWEHTVDKLETVFFDLINKDDAGTYPTGYDDLEEVYTGGKL